MLDFMTLMEENRSAVIAYLALDVGDEQFRKAGYARNLGSLNHSRYIVDYISW